jgi:hypothetical protein
MRFVLATLVLAAACGSKAPAPAEPAEDETTEPAEPTGATDEDGNPVEIPEGGFVGDCDDDCATGCNEVEDYDGCMDDCGCASEGE